MHLWVEGFFEVFATTVIAFFFSRLGLIHAATAAKAALLATAIYLAGGIIGTCHPVLTVYVSPGGKGITAQTVVAVHAPIIIIIASDPSVSLAFTKITSGSPTTRALSVNTAPLPVSKVQSPVGDLWALESQVPKRVSVSDKIHAR